MRSRLTATLIVVPLLLSLVASLPLVAQDIGDPRADGLMTGDYLFIGAGSLAPVNAKGTFRDWNRGTGYSLLYENWSASGSGGVSLVSYGLGASFSQLPLNQRQFLADFTPPSGTVAVAATSSSATTFLIGTNARIRIPSPIAMPSVGIGFGYFDYRPATIRYTTSAGATNSASESHRRGAAFSFSAGVDKQLYDRFALYAEGVYTYAFTNIGVGYASPGGTCAASACDVLKNTAVGALRGGLRVRTSR